MVRGCTTAGPVIAIRPCGRPRSHRDRRLLWHDRPAAKSCFGRVPRL